MRTNAISLLVLSFCLIFFNYAQESRSSFQHYLIQNQTELGLSSAEIENWTIYDQHTDESLGLTYTYIQQTHEKIPVYNATANFVSKDDVVYLTGNNLLQNISENVNSVTPTLSHLEAINAAAFHMNLQQPEEIKLLDNKETKVYQASDLSAEDIPVKLMLFPINPNEIRLVWDLSIRVLDGNDWWSLKIDALTGDLLDKVNWTLYCNFGNTAEPNHDHYCSSSRIPINPSPVNAPAPPPSTDQYNVFAIPTESPNHGPRTLVIGPYDATASPYGWHDDNGSAGAEYTYTRGNNVRATEDVNDNNGVGFMPDGGVNLDFDFPLNLNQAPSGYQDVAITNLFYMNNIMHDVWYHYGFDEASGNFQQNNYGNGGVGSDYVHADAQDGGGTNNANFSTPSEGNNPRMQMYLWSPGIQNLLTVNSPSNVSGTYSAIEAGFGSPVPLTPITSDLVLFDDNSGVDPNDACESAVNAAAMNGNIVVIRRGDCEFGFKVLAAENAGATAVIMINNVPGGPITMGAGAVGGSVTIPSVMISDVDGALLMAEMSTGTVNATLQNPGTAYDLDGDFDNGIIAHEYGHGISTRLTGGASNSNCLGNDEQMGEGWSDWFGLMLTMESGDSDTDIRGIGTYASGEAPSGYGIRPAPYTTDLAINNYTYDATNNSGSISQPHGIGFVWCTMLWDMTWALIDEYGFDTDFYYGSGGNNIAMHLVMNGLKLQSCSPGFVDGRDAILQADQLLYGGANQCLIWNAFAARGLGYSANQGSANSRTDQTEAFDLPPGFVNSSGSANITECTSYTWNSNGQTYTNSGSYTAILSNAVGCDSIATLNLTINAPTTATETAVACNSYTWALDGNTYTNSGLYTTTLVNAAGCDSIVTLDLTINTNLSSNQDITACTAYIWPADGNTYNTTGTYTALLTSAAGCDSLVTLNLTMSTSAQSSETVASCVSYLWPPTGTTYTTSGTYTTTLLSTTGCDSIVTLFLTINSPTSGSSSVSVCDSYTWTNGDGNTYSSTGTYSTTLLSSEGCDSIATLILTILPISSGPTETITSCGIYTWPVDGNIYNSTGIYTANLVNSYGCDSVMTLDLTIAANNSGTASVTACNDYFWVGTNQTYTSSGTYTATLTNSSGCDSVATLDLTINTISTSISYVDVITLTAGQSGATYQWLDCNNNYSPIVGETNQTFVASINGSYAVEVTLNGCVDTTSCRSVSNVGIIENDFTGLDVFPNPTYGKITVSLGEYSDLITTSLFNMNGQLIEQKEFVHSASFELWIEGAPAYYILEVKTLEDKKAKIKILKE